MLSQTIYATATARDTPAPEGEARRFTTQLVASVAVKIADGLIDPKLVLSWLLSAVGAPGYLIGALVPVREAGSLLPQLALARGIERSPYRKRIWAAGSALQGAGALTIALAAVTLKGAMAGWVVLGALAVLACARAANSASTKDILARTLEKGTRGTLTGTAGSIGAAVVFGYAVLLSLGVIPREAWAIASGVAVAGALWIGAALLYLTLDEPAADTGGAQGIAALWRPLHADPQFRVYLLTRALLTATALAPPFLVMLSHSADGGTLGNLGLFMIASAMAGVLSSYVWGRLSDRSSRMTLVLSAGAAALVLGGAALAGITTGGLGPTWMAAVVIFVAQIAYEGVRAGRKTYLTDMDTGDAKATYTALANSLIGVVLLAGGGFGVLADVAGPETVLVVFACLALGAVPVAWQLDEVSKR